MTISTLNSSVGASTATLIKLITGEYTAASVAADPKDATRLWLVKEPDGNYGPAPPLGASAKAQSSSTVLSTLDSLRLGGQ